MITSMKNLGCLRFQAQRKSPVTKGAKTAPHPEIDFKIQNLEVTLQNLTDWLHTKRVTSKITGCYGWESTRLPNGQMADIGIQDDFLALWDDLQGSLEYKPLSPNTRDRVNLGMILLMNEDARSDSTGDFLFKEEKGHARLLRDLTDPALRDLLKQISRPGGGKPRQLANLVTSPPTPEAFAQLKETLTSQRKIFAERRLNAQQPGPALPTPPAPMPAPDKRQNPSLTTRPTVTRPLLPPEKRLDYQVEDLETAVPRLMQLIEAQCSKQRQTHAYGWESIDPATGTRKDPVQDDVLALWHVVQPLLSKPDLSPMERDTLNVGGFLLMNEDKVREGKKGPLLFRQAGETGHSKRLARLTDEKISLTLTQILAPDVTLVGHKPLALTGLTLQPPDGNALSDLAERMQKRKTEATEEARQRNQAQDESRQTWLEAQEALHAETQRQQDAEADRQRQRAEAQNAEAVKQYRLEFALDRFAALATARRQAKEGFHYPGLSQKIEHFETQAQQILQALGRQTPSTMDLKQSQNRLKEASQLQETANRLRHVPAVEFQFGDIAQSIDLLYGKNGVINRVKQEQARHVTLQYEEPLQASDNTGACDEALALWQWTLSQFQNPHPSPQEISAVDVALFLLINQKETDREVLSALMSEDPERIAQYSQDWQLSYPSEQDWEKCCQRMKNKLKNYSATKARQEEQIRQIRWKNSPAGRAQRAAQQRAGYNNNDDTYSRRSSSTHEENNAYERRIEDLW